MNAREPLIKFFNDVESQKKKYVIIVENKRKREEERKKREMEKRERLARITKRK